MTGETLHEPNGPTGITVRAAAEYAMPLEQQLFERRVARAKGERRLAPLRSMSDAARFFYAGEERPCKA